MTFASLARRRGSGMAFASLVRRRGPDGLRFAWLRAGRAEKGLRGYFIISVMSGPPRSVWPPSTAKTWPVIHEASSPRRKRAAAAMSSTVPRRPSGISDS